MNKYTTEDVAKNLDETTFEFYKQFKEKCSVKRIYDFPCESYCITFSNSQKQLYYEGDPSVVYQMSVIVKLQSDFEKENKEYEIERALHDLYRCYELFWLRNDG